MGDRVDHEEVSDAGLVQGSEEWLAARLGLLTSSVVGVLWGTKAGMYTLACKLLAERLTGRRSSDFKGTKATEWGKEYEARARKVYERYRKCEVTEAGLIHHPTLELLAASPDGLVSWDGGVEIKCPNTATLLGWVGKYPKGGPPPPDYKPQMLHQLECTKRLWWDFVAFDPRLTGKVKFHCWRFEPTDEELVDYRSRLSKFLIMYEELKAKCQT